MTDYMVAVPVTLFLAGFFFYAVAALFTFLKEHPKMVLLWLGTGTLLVLDSLYAGLMIAQDTLAADLTVAARVGYLVTMAIFFFSLLYFLIYGIEWGGKKLSSWSSYGGFRR